LTSSEGELFEDFHGGRRRSRFPGLLRRRQLELVEQNLAELLRRVHIELLARQLEDT
jgi:hypothetical protein